MRVFFPLFFPLAACTDYNLQGKEKPEQPAGNDSAAPDDDDDGDSGGGDSSDPVFDTADLELPPGAARLKMYAHSGDTLYSVSPVAPYALTRIGSFIDADTGEAVVSMTDIAIDLEGRMVGVSFDGLYRIDATTALVEPVPLSGGGDSVGGSLNALTFLADGTLLAGSGTGLYSVDLDAGTFSIRSSIGSWLFAGDMVGLPDGLLYCSMADTSEGDAPSALVIYDPVEEEIRLANWTGAGTIYGVAYADETLFGFTESKEILIIDQATGTATTVASPDAWFWGATTNPVLWD